MGITENSQKFRLSQKKSVPSLESFEETYKTAYSHGLEAIYSLKNVDLKTVRKISEDFHVNEPVQNSTSTAALHHEPYQLELELGDILRGWVKPLFLREPISLLGLQQHIQVGLLEKGVLRIGDLIGKESISSASKGHVDEIKNKLKQYIGNRSIERSYQIEIRSLLLSTVLGIDLKKVAVFLMTFGIEDLLPLTRSDNFEIKAIKPFEKKVWIEQVQEAFQVKERKQRFFAELTKITSTFFVTWIRKRGGVVERREILERVEMLADQKEITKPLFRFIKCVYPDWDFPLPNPLSDIFCSDSFTESGFLEITACAKTYFYEPSISYSFVQLLNYLCREFCLLWKSYSREFIETVIRKSPEFYVRRALSGELVVRLS